MKKLSFLAATIVFSSYSYSQILVSNGAQITLDGNVNLLCNGGIELRQNTMLLNNAEIKTTKLSQLPNPGSIFILNGATMLGNGEYSIENEWHNNGIFNAQASEVILYGNELQVITSSNNTVTTFHDLTLSGAGQNVDRQKQLVNVDARVGTTGTLSLNDREFNTLDKQLYIDNPSVTAIHSDMTFGNEGFISSSIGGYVVQRTNQAVEYFFPLGSSAGPLKFRPVTIRPTSSANAEFALRFNNHNAMNDGYSTMNVGGGLATVNNQFYHDIQRRSGNVNADLSIHFHPATDQHFTKMGNWNGMQWQNMNPTSSFPTNTYNYIQKNNHTFQQQDQYVLADPAILVNVPNVFSPNGDGVNEMYFIEDETIEDFDIVITDRWGLDVYKSTDAHEGWDGTSKGRECPEGVYFYLLKAKKDGQSFEQKGFITIPARY